MVCFISESPLCCSFGVVVIVFSLSESRSRALFILLKPCALMVVVSLMRLCGRSTTFSLFPLQSDIVITAKRNSFLSPPF